MTNVQQIRAHVAVDNLAALPQPRPLEKLTSQYFSTMQVEHDAAAQALFCFMRPEGRPSYTPELLRDMAAIQGQIYQAVQAGGSAPFRYVVVGSRIDGAFNLGGDLTLFQQSIRDQNRKALTTYAHACVDIVYHNALGYGQSVMTVTLVQGDTLGGGFEAVLACNYIVAERGARFGLPEVLFNLFPGMGAYSFLSRRLDAVRAEKLIMSGKVYTAEELHEMGLVDVLAEDGEGETALRAFLAKIDRRHNSHQAVLRARQRVNPLTHEELRDVVEIWVDAALQLSESDLRKMSRLIAAQTRRHGDAAPRMAAE